MVNDLVITLGRFDSLRLMTIDGEQTGYLQVNGHTVTSFNLKESLTVKVIRQPHAVRHLYPTSI